MLSILPVEKYCDVNNYRVSPYLMIKNYSNSYYFILMDNGYPYYLPTNTLVSFSFPKGNQLTTIACNRPSVLNSSLYMFQLAETHYASILEGGAYLIINENGIIKKILLEHLVKKG